jgi:sugar transferase (PEP-CTERM/EpsH1 system associated)
VRILYLCHRIPYPPDKGEKIRAFHQIAQLAQRHEVHLVSFGEHPYDPANAEALRRTCASVEIVHRTDIGAAFAALVAVASGRPLSIAAYDSRALAAAVAARCRATPPDVAIVYTAAMAPYAEDLGCPRLLDFVDVDSEKWRVYGERLRPPISLLYAFEARRLTAYEARLAASFEHSALISEAEARILAARVPGLRVSVIPNGVDFEYFKPTPPAAGVRSDAAPRAVFVGMMDYYPNCDAVVHFANDILPLVRAEVPSFEFHIVGRQPTARVRALGRLPGVTVVGGVADVRPHLAEALVSVAPFRIARGIQNKVLEAMASGVPVIGTALAFQGIPARVEDGIRIADDPATLAGLLVELARTPSLRAERGAAARAYVERHHRWDVVGAALEEVLERLVERSRGGPERRGAGTAART